MTTIPELFPAHTQRWNLSHQRHVQPEERWALVRSANTVRFQIQFEIIQMQHKSLFLKTCLLCSCCFLLFVCCCFYLSWQQLTTSWLSLLVWMCLLCCVTHLSITLQRYGGPSPRFVKSEGHCMNGAHLSETLCGLHGLCCIYFIRWRERISCVRLSIPSNTPLITPSTRGESGYVFTKVTSSAS